MHLHDDLVDRLAGALELAVGVGLPRELVAPLLDVLGGIASMRLAPKALSRCASSTEQSTWVEADQSRSNLPCSNHSSATSLNVTPVRSCRRVPRRASTRISSSSACASRRRSVPGIGAPLPVQAGPSRFSCPNGRDELDVLAQTRMNTGFLPGFCSDSGQLTTRRSQVRIVPRYQPSHSTWDSAPRMASDW